MQVTNKTKPAQAPKNPPGSLVEATFLAGRALALEMVQEGQTLAEDHHEIRTFQRRAQRHGAQFKNFALQYLQRLQENPLLIEGFASVLTAVLSTEDQYDPSALVFPYAEFLEGKVGADGTASYDQAGIDPPDAAPMTGDAVWEPQQDAPVLPTHEQRHARLQIAVGDLTQAMDVATKIHASAVAVFELGMRRRFEEEEGCRDFGAAISLLDAIEGFANEASSLIDAASINVTGFMREAL